MATLQGNPYNLQGSMPKLQGGFVGPILQPTANPQRQGFVGPILQPTVKGPTLQPAATAQHLQPAATAQQLQPAVGGVPKMTPPQTPNPLASASFGFMDGSQYNQQGSQLQAPSAPSYSGGSYNAPTAPSTPNYYGGTNNTTLADPYQLQGYQGAAPAMPQVDTSQLSELEKLIQSYYQMSPEEEAARQAYNDQISSRDSGIAAQRAIPKPMELIRGASQNILENSAVQEQTLQQRLALSQAKRQAALDASKFALTREDEKVKAQKEAQKPISVGDGGTLIDPTTGKVIFQNPKDQSNSFSLGFDPLTGSPYVLNSRTGQLNGGGTNLGTTGTNYGQGLSFNTGSTGMRTDRHNNPTAFTTEVAKQAGLVEGVDYTIGDAFPNNPNLKTAKLLGDPVGTTIKVIDKIGFYTPSGQPRWTYINQIPDAKNWSNLSYDQKAKVVAQMYQHEGGNGSLVSGTSNDPVSYYGQQVQQNPQSYNQLTEQAKKLAQEYFRRQGIPIPDTIKPSDTQNQSAGFATRIQQASSVIDTLEQAIASYNPVGFAAQLKLPSWAQSSQIQQYQQAALNLIGAKLRKESGAAISQTEYDNAYAQYLPRAGDSAAVLKQKKQNRDTILQGEIQNAGSAYSNKQSSTSNNNDPLGLGI
jgi:hypothetical protein